MSDFQRLTIMAEAPLQSRPLDEYISRPGKTQVTISLAFLLFGVNVPLSVFETFPP